MNASPSISIIIPCYNGAKYLRETLDSVVAQTLPALEVLVVDDGSTDDSAAIAESFGPPVRVIRQPNQGESVARNRGIDEAKGEWVAFLDADDLWRPEKLAVQAKLMVAGAGAVCAGNSAIYPDGRDLDYPVRPETLDRGWIMEHGAPCHISTLVVRRDVPARFPVWTKYSEDVVYYLDLLKYTPVAVADHVLAVYRKHSGGQTAKPEMREQQDASLQRWLDDNRDQLSKEESAKLIAAFRRREKWSLLSQALAQRKLGRPATALALYGRVLLRSLLSPSSSQIVRSGCRSFVGAAAETVRVRRQPA